MNRTVTAALAVTVSLLATRAASADTRSWTAVKKVVGKGDTAVVGIDLAKLRTTTAFRQGLDLFLDNEPEAKGVMDAVKSECGFDIVTTLSDLTVVMQGDDHPLVAFGLDGIDEAKVVDCLGKVAGKMVGATGIKLTGKKIGKITEYSVKGEKKKLYAAWLAKDVLVFTDDANDRKKLEKRLTGKGAHPDLKAFLGKASPAAPFWFAVAQKDTDDGRTILGGYGKVEIAGAMFKAAGAVVTAKPADATSMVAEANQALAAARANDELKKMPELARALGTVTLSASGAEIVIGASIADKDIATIVPQFDHLF